MPVIDEPIYKPHTLWKSGHFNTAYAYSLRAIPSIPFKRKRVETADGDFFDVDLLQSNHPKLAIVLHGLEGSSSSQYIVGTSHLLHASGIDIAALNSRSCSGEMNRLLSMYHSGFTRDVHTLVEMLSPQYEEVYLVGFSMGGNIMLKYSLDGIFALSENIQKIIAVSTPLDLSACANELMKRQNVLYSREFLKSLKNKARLKQAQFPDGIDWTVLPQIKDVRKFDDLITAPIHGFEDAEDYYQKCNSLQFLHRVTLPTLIINALDDPFLSGTCYPYQIAQDCEKLYLMATEYGGHVGYCLPGKQYSWVEKQIRAFLMDELSLV